MTPTETYSLKLTAWPILFLASSAVSWMESAAILHISLHKFLESLKHISTFYKTKCSFRCFSEDISQNLIKLKFEY